MTTNRRDRAAAYLADNWRIRRRLPRLTHYAHANRQRLGLEWVDA